MLSAAVHRGLVVIGASATRFTGSVGGIATTAYRTGAALRHSDADEFMRSMRSFGVGSLPIILATAIFTGIIMVLQAATYVQHYGVYNLVGWFTGFATFREVGPLLVGLMFSGRVGASNTSELGTMKVSEHFDALKILALDPFAVMIAPRLLAMVLSLVALVIFADCVSIISGAFCAKILVGVDFHLFFLSLVDGLEPWDFLLGLAKASVFGAVIAVVSSFFGMAAVDENGGSAAVGRAVHSQVVGCAIALFVADYLMALVWH